MRRWGQISDPKPASWYIETAKKVYQPAIYRKATEQLIAAGKLEPSEVPPPDYDGFRPVTSDFIDGMTYDAKDPVGYLNGFQIGNKDSSELATK
jgi:nitrate/nitrite transport system substrate-binding protein